MKIRKYAIYCSLFLIITFAAFLRLWKLGSIPPGLTPDEAALGYNAYSVLKTGRDEYGKFMPVIFKSFGDYKPGLYVYLTVPSIALFGLNEFAVRLPSALFGILAVLLIYLLSNELKRSEKFGILSAALLAINPWHIQFSRGAWEVNVALTMTLIGIYFFFKSFKESHYLILSSMFFALTLATYQGAKLSTSVVLAVLLFVYLKPVKKLIKGHLVTVITSLMIGLFISFPILLSLFQGKTGRLEVFSVFSYTRPQEYIQQFLSQGNEKIRSLSYYAFHSEGFNMLRGILGRWFNHFSGRFLLFEGDYQNPRQSPPYQGMLLLVDIILIPLGLIKLIQKREKLVKFILIWLVLAPLPAILTRDQVQSVRAFNMVIPLVIISSFGLVYLIKLLKGLEPILRYLSFSLFVFLFLGSLIYYLDSYFVHLPVHNAKDWFYGYKQVVDEITKIQGSYNKIIFQQSYDQPYIYFLFYQKYDPGLYQQSARLLQNGPDVGLVESLNNIEFRSFSWPVSAYTGELIVGDSIAIPENFSTEDYTLVDQINYPSLNSAAFRIIEAE